MNSRNVLTQRRR